MEKMSEFQAWCSMMNLRNELIMALKTCNVKFLAQGFEFFIKNRIYMHLFQLMAARLPRFSRAEAPALATQEVGVS